MSEFRRRGVSITYKLPLLITALLVVMMAIAVALAYGEVKQSALDSASDRLRSISQQLADLVAPSITQRIETMSEVAEDAAVLRFVTSPTDAARAAAESTIAAAADDDEADLPRALFDADFVPILRMGEPPTDGSGNATAWPDSASVLPDSAGVGPFFQVGGRPYYWVLSAARRGDATIAYFGELRTLGGADTEDQISMLVGGDTRVFLANTSGGIWVTLGGAVSPPHQRSPFTGSSQYTDDGGLEQLGYASPIPGTPWSIITERPVTVVLAGPMAFLRRMQMMALLLGLVGAAGAWIVSRRITQPLKELRLASEAITQGDYDRRIQIDRGDELGVLAGSFNVMAARVEASHDELKQQYETAQSLAGELDRANRAKSEFLATMSHEIRTPINAIIGYTDLLQVGVGGPVTDEQSAHLERIRVSGKHLTSLVDQVLDLARVEAGTLHVERQVAPAAAAVDTALTVVRPDADSKRIALATTCDVDPELHYLGDPHRVDQILVNLLSNAIKFTDPGGEVTVTCEAAQSGESPPGSSSGRWLCVRVRDTGAGIPAEQLERIFEPFVQVESGYTRRHSGTGLGLAISQRLAHSMGGALNVESQLGTGSLFTLWLPLHRPH